jgi:transposase
MSQSSRLVAGIVPGINRQPLKKLAADEATLLQLLYRWRDEATKAGRTIDRIAVAYEAGRDGFWLARWLRGRGIEAYVIYPTSVAVSREHRRAKKDRLDTELLKRAFLGWLRGEPRHCSMAKIPTPEEEDAKRPNRERENLVSERTRIAGAGHRHRHRSRTIAWLASSGCCSSPIRRAVSLVHEILSRNLRDRKVVARYAGLTGSPDESGARREKGLARAGNARVRRGMIQLARRFLMFQKNSALAQWYHMQTADRRGTIRKTMIVALARKLLVALWQPVTTGEVPEGVVLRPAA